MTHQTLPLTPPGNLSWPLQPPTSKFKIHASEASKFKIFTLLLLLLTACGPAAQPAAPPTPAPKNITISFTEEPDSLNPLYSDRWVTAITLDLWLPGLWNFDDQNRPVPQLAAELPTRANGGLSADGRTVTLRLRPEAVWSDGTPLTSADVKFTYDMLMADSNTVLSRYPYDLYVTDVAAPDERTVVVSLAEPFAPLLTSLFPFVLPRHVLQPVFDQAGSLDQADWNQRPTVSSGPFVLAGVEAGSWLLFRRNPAWFGPPPHLDQLTIRFIPDDAAQVLALKNGEVDLGTYLSYADVPGLRAAGLAVTAIPSGINEGLFPNLDPATSHPALLDARVRRAVAVALDRARLSEDLLLGLTRPAESFWANSPLAYGQPDRVAYPYDPAEAGRLLTEAGWVDSNGDGTRDKDGRELVLRYLTTDRQLRREAQAVIQQMWAAVGIGAELGSYPDELFFSPDGPLAQGQYDLAQYALGSAFPDPDAPYWLCSEVPPPDDPAAGLNWQGYCNEELDELFTAQLTALDPAARGEVFGQIQAIMAGEVIWIGLWQDPDLWASHPRLGGLRLSGATPFWNVTGWDVP